MAHDVYSYGMISYCIFYILKSKIPGPDEYSEITHKYKNIGGNAANSSIVLGKLGVKVKLDGNWLSTDEYGLFVENTLKRFNIDITRLTKKDNYWMAEEVKLIHESNIAMLGTYRNLLFTNKQWNTPIEEDIKQSKIISVDPFFHDESNKVSELCVHLNKPYITIDEKYDNKIIQNANVSIISKGFRKREYKDTGTEDLFREYVQNSKGTIIFTSGEHPLLFGKKGDEVKRFTPYTVTATDTTGAGDSFRAGIIYGLLKEWDMEKCIQFGCALAAMICQTIPGILNCPGHDEIIKFMENN